MNETPSEERTDRIVALIAPLMAHQRHKWAAQCQAYGVSMLHFQVLAILDADGPTPMSRLAEQLDVSFPNASGIVGRLEERGVVVRVHDETDRRMVLAQLTPEGNDMLRRVEETRMGHLRQLVEVLSPDERATVLEALTLLAKAHDRYHTTHGEEHPGHAHGPATADLNSLRETKETAHS